MKKIILASASRQRQSLLRRLGIRFTVCPSRVREIKKITGSCAGLVKKNALLKARDVAKRQRDGVVVAADTLVYLDGPPRLGRGKKIIGKPKDLKDAKRILKLLFARPHWVYTGVAVIDTESGKEVVDYEKTRIFMSRLSSEEIDRYHLHASPLDKAGGFDIEGKGGLFIRRIEGCYFNVIGLPMAKLFSMFKKVGVTILQLCFMVWLLGCATEYNLATGQQETLIYGTEKEISLGNSLSRRFEKHFKFMTDVDVNERVEKILKDITAVCDRKDLMYSIKVIDEDKVNAISLPGGYIYLYKGLIDKVKTDDELAAVIGHEVGHITARHAIKKLQAMYGYTLLQLATVSSGHGQMAPGFDIAFTAAFLQYSQEDEFLADKLGIKYAQEAGYDPKGMIDMLKVLKAQEEKGPAREFTYWRTHPFISQRISKANQEVSGQMNFRDYLNLTGEK